MKIKVKNAKFKILGFIANWTEKNNQPPTLQQIADGLGLKAKSTIAQHLYEMGISYNQKDKRRLFFTCPFCGKPKI